MESREFNTIRGLPWEPIPGLNGNQIEVKSLSRYREEEEEIFPMPKIRESLLRRLYIRREDVSDRRNGLTLGSEGSEAASRGSTEKHNETCRLNQP